MVMIFSIGAALTNVFGRMVDSQRQGSALFGVMGFLWLVGSRSPSPKAQGGDYRAGRCTDVSRSVSSVSSRQRHAL
jgi:Potassium-transporting ATPase A subunit